MKWFSIIFTIALSIELSTNALAWGPSGHRIICEIAWQSLDADPRKAIRSAANRMGYQTFAQSCVWADQIRSNARFDSLKTLHYVNVPRAANSVNRSRDCSETGKSGCVLTAISDYKQRWRNSSLAQQQRDQALLLLSHFVGDVHQPMHVSYRFDRGGNRRMIGWMSNRELSLHSLWDSAIINCNNKTGWRKIAGQLHAKITPQQRQQWRNSAIEKEHTIDEWANESLALTRDIYRYLDKPWKPSSYCLKFTPVARQRLQMAGVRLALLLDD